MKYFDAHNRQTRAFAIKVIEKKSFSETWGSKFSRRHVVIDEQEVEISYYAQVKMSHSNYDRSVMSGRNKAIAKNNVIFEKL